MKAPISIIGYGRLGKLLQSTLQRAGYDQISIVKKGDEIILLNELVFIAVPDSKIANVIEEIKKSDLNLSGKSFAHTSGVVGLDVFDSIKSKKVNVGCLHPLMAITESSTSFEGITFDVCGDKKFIKKVHPLVQDLDAEMLIVDEEQKAKLHLAAVLTSNYMITLMELGLDVFDNDELELNKVKEALLPLMSSAIKNLETLDPNEALTGPIARGDAKSIEKHLELLAAKPKLKAIYAQLASRTLDLVSEKLSDNSISEIKRLVNET